MKKLLIATAIIAVNSAASAAITALDFGANYSDNNINMSVAGVTTYATGDYNFNGSANDRVVAVPFGTAHTVTNAAAWTTPEGKSGATIYTGFSLANIGSSTDPAFGLYRWNGSANNLQTTSGTAASRTSAMRMATAYYWEKADFLNGMDASTELSFANMAGSASVSYRFSGEMLDDTLRLVRLMVRDGAGDWYLSASRQASGTNTLQINAATEEWHAYDPVADSMFYDRPALESGASISGTMITDITAFGVLYQSELFDGTADTHFSQHQLDALQFQVIPEPRYYAALFGMLALALIITRRRSGPAKN